MNFKFKHTLILIFLSIAFFWSFTPENLKLGLDLKGGSALLFKTENHEKNFTTVTKREILYILEKNEIYIGDFIAEKDEGLKFSITPLDPSETKRVGEILANNNFKPVIEENKVVVKFGREELEGDFREKMDNLVLKIKNRLDQYGLSEPYVIKEGRDKIYIELPGVDNMESLNNNIKLIQTPAKLAFHPVNAVSDTHVEGAYRGKYDGYYYKLGHHIFTGENIKNANTMFENGSPGVSFSLDALGSEVFADFTGNNINKQLAIVLDGEVLSAPRISSRIGGGQAQITGNYTTEETKLLSISLKSGSLPINISLQESKMIGPSLGEKNIKYGVYSIGAGFALVMLFLVLYYKRNGLVILGALLFNIILVFFVVYKFGFVLTLPGLAGLILTIGMAVDANIIIQERIKELDRGGETAGVVSKGYEEAKVAIYDANITTILVGVILYSYGTGPLKSFALLLIVGIITSIYTSIYFTEEIQKHFYKGKKNEKKHAL